MKFFVIFSLVTFSFIDSIGFAGDVPKTPTPKIAFSSLNSGDSLFNDLYVQLYLARYQRRQFEVGVQKQDLQRALSHRQRMESLYQVSSVATEELETARRNADVAALRVREAESSMREAEVLLNIAVNSISLGLEMPICAELQ